MNMLRIPNRKHNRKGQAFVEFAISVVVLTLFGFGAVDLSRAVSTYQRMNSVGREAGRIFLKSSFDTANLTQSAIRAEVKTKVYASLTQAMLPDDLGENGVVIVTIARRVIPLGGSASSSSTDQLKVTHRFTFPDAGQGESNSAGIHPSRISPTALDANNAIIIAGPPLTTVDDPSTPENEEEGGFLPVDTIRSGEELIIVEIFYVYEFMTPIDKVIPGFQLNVLYDRTVF